MGYDLKNTAFCWGNLSSPTLRLQLPMAEGERKHSHLFRPSPDGKQVSEFPKFRSNRLAKWNNISPT